MKFTIDNRSGVPLYRQIIEQVKFAIARGNLGSGDQLPTVRQLAVDLSVNPNTRARGRSSEPANPRSTASNGRGCSIRS